MNKMFRLLSWAVLSSALIVRAAEDAPRPPFVNTAPSQWEVHFTYPTEAGGEARFLKKVSVTKTGDKKREVFDWSDGVQSETWHVAGYVLYQQPHFEAGDVAVLEAEKHLDQGDFRDLSWIGKASFRGEEKRGGRQCHFYEGEPVAGGLGNPHAVPPQVFRAWIDAETRLPVAVERAGVVEEYFFKPGGAAGLTVPPLFTRKLEEFLARKKSIKPLPPPY